MKQFLLSLLLVLPALMPLAGGSAQLSAPRASAPGTERAMDHARLVENLRSAGFRVEEGDIAEQPFLSIEGRMLKVGGEDVQVFQYPHATAADAQAALISTDGSTIGTSKPHWIGKPHFFKRGRLLVLYVGDNHKVLQALNAVLGRQLAGK